MVFDEGEVSTSVPGSGKDENGTGGENSRVSNIGVVVSQNSSCKNGIKCSCDDDQTGNKNSSDSSKPQDDSHPVSSASPFKQSVKCCLKQRFGSVLYKEDFSDVTFIVGKEAHKQKVHAHKLVLSVGSDVFKAMFSENWASKSCDIEVPDVEPAEFSILLRYLYTDEVSLTCQTVAGTLFAAKKYCILPLENHCIKYLTEHLCPENAFAVLTHATSFEEKEMINSCLKLIDEDTDVAVSDSGFLDINSNLLSMVLERDTLNIREIELFLASLRWCSAECGRRSLKIDEESQRLVLKEILPLIRFSLMSVEEISLIVAPTGLLTHEQLMTIHNFRFANTKPAVNFNSRPRFWQTFTVNRFQEIAAPFEQSGSTHSGPTIQFEVDREVRFAGVGLYGPICQPTKYSIKLNLSHALFRECIHEEFSVHKFDKTALVFQVLLSNPIKLKPDTAYKVWVNIQGPPSFYGKKGVKEVTETLSHERPVTVTFSSVDKNLRTNEDEGQIPELIFTT